MKHQQRNGSDLLTTGRGGIKVYPYLLLLFTVSPRCDLTLSPKITSVFWCK